MVSKILNLLIAVLLCSSAFAEDGVRVYLFGIPLGNYAPYTSPDTPHQITEWANSDWSAPYMNLNPVRLSNRADCAIESTKPSLGTYLVLDSMPVAMSAYRFGVNRGLSPENTSRLAVARYRAGVLEQLSLIANSLLRGELPLLPSSISKDEKRKEFMKAQQNCSQEDCGSVEDYVQRVMQNWFPGHSQSSDRAWSQVDSFDKTNHFINADDLLKKRYAKLSCYKIKRYSTWQALNQTITPTYSNYLTIANQVRDQDYYLQDCSELSNDDDLEAQTFQLELIGLKKDRWDRKGFDFWYSLKLYFSWWWRNNPKSREYFSPFDQLMKSIDLESSLIFLPTGCRSLSVPSCDPSYLSQQQLRTLFSRDFSQKETSFDFSYILPEGPEVGMLDQRTPSISVSTLDMAQFADNQDWVTNFRNNLIKTRGVLKSRLLKAANFLGLFSRHRSAIDVINDLRKLKALGQVPQVDFKDHPYDLKTQLYYLCSEFMVAANPEFSLVKKDLDLLQNITSLDPIFKILSGNVVGEYYKQFDLLSKEVVSFCGQLEKEAYFNLSSLDKSGFSSWYKQKFLKGINTGEDKIITGMMVDDPFLALKSFNLSRDVKDTVCLTSIDCARDFLEAMITIYGLSLYQSMIMPPNLKASSVSSNPYAERMACGVYDPYWGYKRSVFTLVADGLVSLLNIAIPSPIMLDLDLSAPRVSSFNKLVENGNLKFHPNSDPAKLLYSLGVEFGPLLGAKCGISINNQGDSTSMTNGAPLYFVGISIGGCVQSQQGGDIVQGSTVTTGPAQTFAGCAACTINFESIGQNVTQAVAGVDAGRIAAPVIRALSRVVSILSNPDDISRSMTIDPNYIYETVRRFGPQLPFFCHLAIEQGRSCLENDEQALVDYFQWYFGAAVDRIDRKGEVVVVEVSDCRFPLAINWWSKFKSRIENGENPIDMINGIKSCRLTLRSR